MLSFFKDEVEVRALFCLGVDCFPSRPLAVDIFAVLHRNLSRFFYKENGIVYPRVDYRSQRRCLVDHKVQNVVDADCLRFSWTLPHPFFNEKQVAVDVTSCHYKLNSSH